ncbi:unnamed protein product [Boreogadus saida]
MGPKRGPRARAQSEGPERGPGARALSEGPLNSLSHGRGGFIARQERPLADANGTAAICLKMAAAGQPRAVRGQLHTEAHEALSENHG